MLPISVTSSLLSGSDSEEEYKTKMVEEGEVGFHHHLIWIPTRRGIWYGSLQI